MLGVLPHNQMTRRGAADAHYEIAAMLRHENVTPSSAAADGVPCTRGDVLLYGDQLSRSRTELVRNVVACQLGFFKGMLDGLHIAMNIVEMIFSLFPVSGRRCARAERT